MNSTKQENPFDVDSAWNDFYPSQEELDRRQAERAAKKIEEKEAQTAGGSAGTFGRKHPPRGLFDPNEPSQR